MISGLPPIPRNLKNKKVLLRVDFNVPIVGGRVLDDFRLSSTLPAIRMLQKKGAKTVLISHLESDGGQPSLKGIWRFLRPKIKNLRFSEAVCGSRAEKAASNLKSGQVLLLENLRKNPGEKNNNPAFAKALSKLGDIYINEAFSASHRRHASIVGITRHLPSFAGPLFKSEIKNLSLAFRPPHPFLLIVGGNKLETKTPLLKKFIKKADKIVIGGAVVVPFLFKRIKQNFSRDKIVRPRDLVILRGTEKKNIKTPELLKGDKVYDFGPESLTEIAEIAQKSRFILWNGPLGCIEGGFDSGTKALADILAGSRAKTIVGGGDTAAFLSRRKMIDKFSFVSTGGGAMLVFLAEGTLSGIEALKMKK
ncbi:MAG: phosphoglycerate kinase [Patescibacteria group bacterium]